MSLLGNIVWLLLGGLEMAVAWMVIGCVLCITVIGIPLGLQCFKFARLSLNPFDLDVEYGGGAPSMLANFVWLLVAGLPAAGIYLCLAVAYAITIIGLPIAAQLLKLAKLALMPFGTEVY